MVRTPSATDRRVKLLSLTPAGQEVYHSVWQEADALRRELLGNVDPETLRTVTTFLEALQANIETQP
jgi:MarR family transcriptional regulator for hemolysin